MSDRLDDANSSIRSDFDRWKLVAGQYSDDNPFRLGSDMVANNIVNAAIGLATAGSMGGAVLLIKSAGPKAIPYILGAIAGSAVGSRIVNKLSMELTGKSWDEHIADAGGNAMSLVGTNPGGWAGGYAVGTGVGRIVENTPAFLENTFPRIAMTRQGPMEVPAGETIVIDEGTPTIGGTRGTIYKGKYNTPGNSRLAGLGGHTTRTTGNTHKGVPGARGNRTMSDYRANKGGESSTYANEGRPYVNRSIMGLPVGTWVEDEPTGPLIIASPTLDDYRYVEEESYRDPWEEEYAKHPEGSTFYWAGDPRSAHSAGMYTIRRVNPDIPTSRRDVYDSDLYYIPDSTMITLGSSREAPLHKELGGVPKEAKRGPKRTSKKRNGGVIERFKQYYKNK